MLLTAGWSTIVLAQVAPPAGPSGAAAPAEPGDGNDAATPPGPAEAPWDFSCSQAQKLAERDCRMSQTIVLQENQQVLLRVTVRLPPVEREPAMMLQLPLGIYLPDGVRLTIDQADWTAVPVQTCDAGGCYAGLPVDENALSRLKDGTQLKVSFASLAREDVTVPVSLAGFAQVFDKIR